MFFFIIKFYRKKTNKLLLLKGSKSKLVYTLSASLTPANKLFVVNFTSALSAVFRLIKLHVFDCLPTKYAIKLHHGLYIRFYVLYDYSVTSDVSFVPASSSPKSPALKSPSWCLIVFYRSHIQLPRLQSYVTCEIHTFISYAGRQHVLSTFIILDHPHLLTRKMSINSKITNGDDSAELIRVDSPNVKYTKDYIESTIEYPINYVIDQNNTIVVNVIDFI